MPYFDLEAQNYAQMSELLLAKLLAILKPRAKNPKTNWDCQNAQGHVDKIKDQLRYRQRQPQP